MDFAGAGLFTPGNWSICALVDRESRASMRLTVTASTLVVLLAQGGLPGGQCSSSRRSQTKAPQKSSAAGRQL
jgi:hypothetical protein